MKFRTIILLALALVFNNFVGTLIMSLGILLCNLGNLFAKIPSVF